MYSSIHSRLVSVSVVAVNRADVHFDSLTTCLCVLCQGKPWRGPLSTRVTLRVRCCLETHGSSSTRQPMKPLLPFASRTRLRCCHKSPMLPWDSQLVFNSLTLRSLYYPSHHVLVFMSGIAVNRATSNLTRSRLVFASFPKVTRDDVHSRLGIP
jgi:hypothetical protein